MYGEWIKGYENKYSITTDGRVFAHDYHRQGIIMEMKCKLSNRGYTRVGLRKDGGKQQFYSVHRLVAETYIENPLNYDQVNHIDGNKNNNNVSNLEWCNHSQNVKHAYKTGLMTPWNKKLEVV